MGLQTEGTNPIWRDFLRSQQHWRYNRIRSLFGLVILPPVDPTLEHQVPEKLPLRDDATFAAGKIAVFQYAASSSSCS